MNKSVQKKVLLLGLPNTGKTRLYNHLTRTYGIVSNYPMTTIEEKKAAIKFRGKSSGGQYTLIDAPGFHSLFIQSEEELAVRNLLIRENPDIILHCIDAGRLKQSLFLTHDIIELGIPMVVALNIIDETDAKGMEINEKALGSILGVPVVKTSASEGRGIQELLSALKQPGLPLPQETYPEPLWNIIKSLEEKLPENTPFRKKAAVLALLEDPFLFFPGGWIGDKVSAEEVKKTAKIFSQRFDGNIHYVISRSINKWVSRVFAEAVKGRGGINSRVSETFARLSRNPVTGFPLLFIFLLLCYFSVVHIAGFLEEILTSFIADPAVNWIAGVIPDGFWEDLLIGDYGILTLGLFNAVFTVLPVLSVFFLLFGLMEDAGYLPNLSILIRRVFSKIGLSGKSIMPIVLGFGCKTMATLTARSISSKKERFIAIFLIAFGIPCSAQMGLNMAILGNAGMAAFVIAISFLLLVELVSGAVLNKLIPEEGSSSFIMELPPFRLPSLRAVLKKTYYRLLWFLRESIAIFLIAALALFLFDAAGGLAALQRLLYPVIVSWLGLPVEMVEALILTMARHEIAAGFILSLSNQGKLSFIQSIIAVVITTMFVPCIANIVAIFKEVGTKKGISMVLAINLLSFFLAGLLNKILVLSTGG